ncbi:bifunctional NAD(P)/FAD-dependent oxidoreductase/class I SAM-dependent methyltransferase [Nocardiopsis trehalosi]|uniref:bifunctional NAD(P)/FAD-dependent oxidoreductase/class I SAM-dependent methyltransferase n=1 Tax=Nocardiopsis trehalosi TaxID=109329 RepID=UPI00083723EA|nr:bifunctional NAD(P)/FAD-dependent oxidoreductase/class I SAM-dependent methyltransferase [Nocardiopsis trehalosi]
MGSTQHTGASGAEPHYEVVVIGGGAAGLGAALTLSRARRSVLVVDAGHPRNAPAEGVHAYLGREGTPPLRLLADGREEVAGYGGEFRDGTATAVERRPDGRLRVVLDGGAAVTGDRLVLATGLVDELPEVPGLAERFGRDVLHCPYCHGWEVRDRPVGVLATGPLAVHQALLWRQWSGDVTLFRHTAADLSDDDHERLAARGVPVVEGTVTGLETADDRLTGVVVEGGRVFPVAVLAVAPRFTARTGPYAGLGLSVVEQEVNGHVMGTRIDADPTGRTAAPGVWVAGNATSLAEQAIGSAAAGVRAGAAVNADLIEEETRRAVAARAAGAAGGPAHAGHGHGHGAGSAAAGPDPALPPAEFWDGFYRERDRVWSGRANDALVREAGGLPPGRALDLGCGEGADAVWLAGRGWKVTAVDISAVALERAARHAADAGVGDRITWERADLEEFVPDGGFDLVSAQFLHAPGELAREAILRRAAAAVAPGGVLLVESHATGPSWDPDAHGGMVFPTPEEVLAALELEEGRWEVLRCAEHERAQTAPDGSVGHRTDSTVLVRRRPA